MNHCLAEIGIHHPALRARAIAIGERLKVHIDYPASPGCTPPYVPLWIAEMVRRREGAEAPVAGAKAPARKQAKTATKPMTTAKKVIAKKNTAKKIAAKKVTAKKLPATQRR
jgi:hypothetical protein